MKSIQQSIESHIKPSRPGFKSWFDLLDGPSKKELLEVRKKFHAGGYGVAKRSCIVKAVIATAAECGWPIAGPQGVDAWLRQSG